MVRLLTPVLCFYAACAASAMSSPNPQQPLLSQEQSKAYQARLVGCDGNFPELVKGAYIVRLKSGHNFQDHCRIIGKDGTDPKDFFVDLDLMVGLFPNSISYRCEAVSDQVLGVIRADEGVEEIFCAPFYPLSDLLE
jgi:hypothetical protein